MVSKTSRYAIVGAGPSGLSMAKNLQDLGIPFVVYEAASDVGGLWNIENANSTMYESAHLISSKSRTEFTYFPMKEDVAVYPKHTELRRYFEDYAKAFSLYEHIRFNTAVSKITEEGLGWKITDEHQVSQFFDGVILANGNLSHPNMPQFKGAFAGRMLHSSKYKSAKIFEGQRVLIIGAGNSGCDIAVDAVHHAKSVDMSLRRGYHFVPKFILGKPADTIGGKINLPRTLKQRVDGALLKLFIGDPTKYGFPKPDHKLYESHPIVNSLVLHYAGHGDIQVQKDVNELKGQEVEFVDGVKKEYDLIICATGYRLHYPFLDQKYLNWSKSKPDFYLNIFHPERNNLFIAGLLEAAGIGWQGRDEQCQLIAAFIKAQMTNPEKAEAFTRKKAKPFPDLSGGYKYVKLDRMAYYVHADTYRKYLKTELNFLKG